MLGQGLWNLFTPAGTGFTAVGSPTNTGRWCRVGNIVFFSIKTVPGTTVASVAGTSYWALPYPASASGFGGEAIMSDMTTNIAVGSCVIDPANSRVYVPSLAASGDTTTVNGWFEAA